MRNHDERELALRCLDLAVRAELQNVVLGAGEMLDFVMGDKPAAAPAEESDPALEILRHELRRIDPQNNRLRFVDEMRRA